MSQAVRKKSPGAKNPAPAAIPLTRPDLEGNESRYVQEAITSSWISSAGPFHERFEKEFAQECGTRHALAVSNGTTALHLALITLGVAPGDEIILPSLCYIAVANAVRYVQATPVFVDIDESHWCLSPSAVARAITSRTKGIIAVHNYGHPADMDPLNAIARQNRLWVVEDAAEAIFARYRGRPTGSLATMGTFSFYGNKVITSGEGGALTFNSDLFNRRAKLFRGQGMDPDRRYFFPVIGHNFRLTNLQSAILCAQLERKDEILKRRRRVYAHYQSLLGQIPGIGTQPVADWATLSPWLYSVTLDPQAFGGTRDEIGQRLLANNIETRPFFLPIPTLPPYHQQASFPVAERIAATGLNLPTSSQMTEAEVEKVARTLIGLKR